MSDRCLALAQRRRGHVPLDPVALERLEGTPNIDIDTPTHKLWERHSNVFPPRQTIGWNLGVNVCVHPTSNIPLQSQVHTLPSKFKSSPPDPTSHIPSYPSPEFHIYWQCCCDVPHWHLHLLYIVPSLPQTPNLTTMLFRRSPLAHALARLDASRRTRTVCWCIIADFAAGAVLYRVSVSNWVTIWQREKSRFGRRVGRSYVERRTRRRHASKSRESNEEGRGELHDGRCCVGFICLWRFEEECV